MFDFERAIADWRAELEAAESFKNEDLMEMEVHLRQEFADLPGEELKEDERFLIATRRLGMADDLSAEFAKVNRKAIWRQRFFWVATGIFVWQWAQEAGWFLTYGFWMFVGAPSPSHRMDGFDSIMLRYELIAAILILLVYFAQRFDPTGFLRMIQDWRMKIAFFAAFPILLFAERQIYSLDYERSVRIESLRRVSMLEQKTGQIYYWHNLPPTQLMMWFDHLCHSIYGHLMPLMPYILSLAVVLLIPRPAKKGKNPVVIS